ncbi:hypothetical protein B0H17DRAFT_1102158, partial [Mycena rosella]
MARRTMQICSICASIAVAPAISGYIPLWPIRRICAPIFDLVGSFFRADRRIWVSIFL